MLSLRGCTLTYLTFVPRSTLRRCTSQWRALVVAAAHGRCKAAATARCKLSIGLVIAMHCRS